VRRARDLRSRLAQEHAFTLPELLTVLAILGVVLGALTTMFISGTNAEREMNVRFQAQQNARMALSKMRREIRCASDATTSASVVTLVLGSTCTIAQGSVTWSALPLGPSRYGLFRCQGLTCDTSGRKWADDLTTDALFSYLPPSDTLRPRLRVAFPIDLEPARAGGSYTLQDAIAFRNWVRPAQ
jgi:prepilin-type N-terminal cleavage/methylation domain-containing protein